MVLKSTTFDHSKNIFNDAIQVPGYVRNKCRERIVFACAANYLQATELYETLEDSPPQFHTMTGDFSRTLSLVSDQLEYEFTLLIFSDLYNIINESVQKHRAIHSSDISESSKMKLNLMMQMEELALNAKLQEKMEQADDDDVEYTQAAIAEASAIIPTNIFKRIDLTKQSHYDWNTYWNMVSRLNYFQKKSDNEFDVDDLLSGLFGDKKD